MKIKNGFVLGQVAGVTVALSADRDLDFNNMITINETGALLWRRLEQGAELEDLVRALLDEYDVTEERARSSAAAFVSRLKELGILE